MWMKKKSFAPGIVMLAISVILFFMIWYAWTNPLLWVTDDYYDTFSFWDWILIFSVPIFIAIIVLLVTGIVSMVRAGKTHSIYRKQAAVMQQENSFFANSKPNFDIEIPFGYRHFCVDKAQKLYFVTPSYKSINFQVHRLDDISEIRISENNNVVVDGMGNNTGALVGGILFGAAGAIIGSGGKNTRAQSMIDSLCINIVTKNIDDPHVQIEFLDYPVQRNSKEFEALTANAQKVYATLQSYNTTQKEIPANDDKPSPIEDRLESLAKMRNNGTLTEEEFIEAKAKLLDKM